MTEQIANVSSDVDNAHTVEVFLSALQDEDFDGAAAVLDDNVVYQNVGFPTIYMQHGIQCVCRRLYINRHNHIGADASRDGHIPNAGAGAAVVIGMNHHKTSFIGGHAHYTNSAVNHILINCKDFGGKWTRLGESSAY